MLILKMSKGVDQSKKVCKSELGPDVLPGRQGVTCVPEGGP